ncbi:Fah, partial [Symbiodinium sp. KB8]
MAATASGGSALTTWVDMPADCDWTIHNIPFGVFTPEGGDGPRIGTAIGTKAVDLKALAKAGHFDAVYADTLAEACGGGQLPQVLEINTPCFASRHVAHPSPQTTLNAFMAAGRGAWRDARERLQALFSGSNPALQSDASLQAAVMHELSTVTMHLPATIGDYTDFYSSREHATNVGTMFRGADNALQPNWLHLPVGYHGRASSIVTSGTAVRRPRGQLQKDATDPKAGSVFGPCRLFDFELEMGAFVGPGNKLGDPIPMADAEQHIFGLVLMNDWSARDIQ